MKRFTNIIQKILGFLMQILLSPFILIMILVLFSNAFINNSYTHNYILQHLNTAIRPYAGLTADFKAVKLNLMSLKIDFFGLELNAVEDGENLLAIAHASTGISPANLLLGRIQLAELNIETLAFKPEKLSRAIYNSESLNKNGKLWPPEFPIPFENMSIRNLSTSIGFTYMGEPASISGEQAELKVKLTSWEYIEASINTPAFRLSTDSMVLLEPTKLSSEIIFDGSKLILTEFKLNNSRLVLDGDSTTNLFSKGTLANPITTNSKLNLSGDLSILGGFLDLEQTFGKTKANVSTKINIPIDNKEVTLKIIGNAAIEDGSLYGLSLLDSAIDFDINAERLKFKKINIRENGRNLGEATGELKFNEESSYIFNVRPEKLPLSDLLAALGTDFKEFDFDISSADLLLSGKGLPFQMKVAGNALLADMRFPSLNNPVDSSQAGPTCDFAIDFAIDSNKMNIKNNRGACQGETSAYLDGPLYFSDRGINLDIKFDSNNLGIFTPWVQNKIRGTGSIDTQVVGPWEDIIVKNNFQIKNAFYADIPLLEASGTVSYDIKRSLIEWKKIEGKEISTRYESNSGYLNLNSYQLSTDFYMDSLPSEFLGNIMKMIDESVAFSSEIQTLEGSISGALDKPGTWDGKGKIYLKNGNFAEEKIFDSFISDFDFQPASKNLGSLCLKKGGIELCGSALLRKSSELRGTLLSLGISDHDQIELKLATKNGIPQKNPINKNLQDLPYAAKYLREINLDGDIDGHLSILGSIEKPFGTSELKLKNISIAGSMLPPMSLQTTLVDAAIDSTGVLGGKDNYIRLKLKPWDTGIPYELKYNANQTDVRFLLPEIYAKDPRNFLLFSGFVDLSGEMDDIFNSKGSIDLSQIRFSIIDSSGKAIRVTTRPNKTIRLLRKKVTIENGDEINLEGAGFKLGVRMGNTTLPANLDIKYTGSIELQTLRHFVPQIETASGRMIFQGAVTGPAQNPNAKIQIQNDASFDVPVTLGISGLRPPFSNVQFNSEIDSNKFLLTNFYAEKGPGIIKAFGEYPFSNQPSSGLQIQMTEAALIRTIPFLKDFDSLLSGKVTVQPTNDKVNVSGNINIVRAKLNHEFDIRNEILSVMKDSSFKSLDVKEKASVNFDLGIQSEDGITVTNRNMDLLMGADLKLTGTDIEPKIIGLVEIKQGKFKYRNDYKIIKGLLTFDPSHGTDPSLDITATSEIAGRRVDIDITGRGSGPFVGINVDPPIKDDGSPVTETDALLLVTSGSMPRGGQALSDTNLKSGGLNIIAGQFEKPVERLFDLTGQKIIKEVYLDSYPSNKTGSPLFRANASLQLLEKLDFIIQTDQEQTGFAAEYPIDPSVSSSLNYSKSSIPTGSTTTSSDIGASFDLRFRFQFP